MRTIIASVVVVSALIATPALAQETVRTGKSGGGKGALIGALIGGGAALIYGLATDYCRNPVGEYTEEDKAKFCAAPVAGMIGAGTLVGYFVGRHADRPLEHARADRPESAAGAVDVVALVPPVQIRPLARAPRPEDRFFRNLFVQAAGTP